jgi:hypothetical protein
MPKDQPFLNVNPRDPNFANQQMRHVDPNNLDEKGNPWKTNTSFGDALDNLLENLAQDGEEMAELTPELIKSITRGFANVAIYAETSNAELLKDNDLRAAIKFNI